MKWLARFYNKKGKRVSSMYYFDRTETEAFNEAAEHAELNMLDECNDWTLTDVSNIDEKIINILKRKVNDGIDCTEEESAELKGFLREYFPLLIHDTTNIIFNEISHYFPLEESEFANEK